MVVGDVEVEGSEGKGGGWVVILDIFSQSLEDVGRTHIKEGMG